MTDTFIGRVESTENQTATILLFHQPSGQTMTTTVASPELLKAGVRLGDEFSCQGHMILTNVHRLEPRPISKERVAEIRAQFKDRWNF